MAQVYPPGGDQLFWGDRILYRVPFALGAQATLVESRAIHPDQEKTIQLPPGLLHVHRHDGQFYALRKEGAKEGTVRLGLHRSPDAKAWELAATLEVGPTDTRISSVRVLGGGWYILQSSLAQFSIDRKTSPLALGKINAEGRIRVHSLVDLQLPMDLPLQALGLVFAPLAIPVDRGWVMIHAKTGWGWIIRLSTEGVPNVRRFQIFPGLETALKKGTDLELAVLAAQPTKDGDVLIATRSDEAVKTCRAIAATFKNGTHGRPVPLQENAKPIEKAKAAADAMAHSSDTKDYRFAEDLAVKAHPQVLWWELDPDTGKLTRVDPSGAVILLQGADQLARFGFRYLANGRLIMNRLTAD
jgi:hypothetical protein